MVVRAWGSRPRETTRLRRTRTLRPVTGSRVCLGLGLLLLGYPAFAQSLPTAPAPQSPLAGTTSPTKTDVLAIRCAVAQQPDQVSPGTLRGTVADSTGTVITGAVVTLTREDSSPGQQVSIGEDGEFSFVDLAPGAFRLTITSAGFATLGASGTLSAGPGCILPLITLSLATNVTEVRVELTPVELAQEQIKEQ
jgi:hypothetical protein